MKLLILGHGRHGKDTVAEIFQENYGLTFVSSSYACAEKVMMPAFEARGTPYSSVEECYADRSNHRAFWHEQIAEYNWEDPAALAKEIIASNDMYVGMRSWREFHGTRHLFDATIWVDATGRGIPLEHKDSFNIDYTADMFRIWNCYGRSFLINEVDRVANMIGLNQERKV